ncbi:MAG TPA: ribonuclease HI [Clostridiales bacterium]|jgi:ribonuclease HI|nr:ribonuclease HI [Clostridiales bacterium]HQP69234.1 ribonuclease HI [Clostridiales bacterium]
MKQVTLYTDGACSGNPGPGGWGSIVMYKDNLRKISGFKKDTTNNIMEMTAVLEGMKTLKEKCEVKIYTDSKYVVDSITKWIENWQKNGWKTSSKKDVKNSELWKEILKLNSYHKTEWIWVKGHNGNEYNEECDRMAREEIEKNQTAGKK